MRIRICDIHDEGRDLDFELDKDRVNNRITLASKQEEKNSVAQPIYEFLQSPKVHLHLDLDGSTVVVRGSVKGDFVSVCSRCAEECRQHLEIPFDLILKPKSERVPKDEQEDDMNFGTYENEEIFCDTFSEDFLVLALPFTVLCSEDCKGICVQCGKNLNAEKCDCKKDPGGDTRMSIFKQIKIQ